MAVTNGKTPEQLYQATINCTTFLQKLGYEVIEAWSCEVGFLKGELPRKQTKTYPHTILYDFEAYGDKNYRKEPTGALTIQNAHVPISVSVGDTLERAHPHLRKKPREAGPQVHERAGEAREKHPGPGESGVCARRHSPADKRSAAKNQ